MASAAAPRVAVIGGGFAGTLCSLVLKNRGLQPTIVDSGRQVGGRLRRAGAQFLRTSDPRLATVLGFLEQEGLVAEWKGRFGMLGSLEGGFLPAEIVTQNTNTPNSANPNDEQANENEEPSASPAANPATDGGDFCQFVEGSMHPTFVGVPNMSQVCTSICDRAGIETWNQSTLTKATPLREGGWALDVQTKDNNFNTAESPFEALVVATHDPSIAANAIQSIIQAEKSEQESNPQDSNTEDNALIVGRLSEIANSLRLVRDQHKQPVYTVSLTFPKGFDEQIPFDAVSIPGSQLVQFLAKDASKPNQDGASTWTAVTTSRLATAILRNKSLVDFQKQTEVEATVASEVAKLLTKYTNGSPIEPIETQSFRWGAAFSNPGLKLKEDSIVLAPWRLSICGDYIRDTAAYSNPLEAAALSGLEAGERTAAFWRQED